MPMEAFLIAAGGRNHAGKTGLLYDHVGRISVSQAARPGVDENLWACLKIAVDELRLAINIDSMDMGSPGPISLHGEGRAVTVNRVGAVHKKWRAATLRNPQAVQLTRYLLAHGFQVGAGTGGAEGGVPPEGKTGTHKADGGLGPGQAALLFGPAGTLWNPSERPHTHHLHLSLPQQHRPDGALGERVAGEVRVGAVAAAVE